MKMKQIKDELYFFDNESSRTVNNIVDEINLLVKGLSETLTRFDYELSNELAQGVISGWGSFIREKTLRDFDEWVKSSNMPKHLRMRERASVEADIPNELMHQLAESRAQFSRLCTSLPNELGPKAKDFKVSNGAIVLCGQYMTRIQKGFVTKVADEEMEVATRLAGIFSELRKVNETGIKVNELTERFVGNRYQPSQYAGITQENILLAIADGGRAFTLEDIWRAEKRLGVNATIIHDPEVVSGE